VSQPECQLLLKKARNSLEAARLLLKNNLADIAVTKAYYTMFYCAEALYQLIRIASHEIAHPVMVISN